MRGFATFALCQSELWQKNTAKKTFKHFGAGYGSNTNSRSSQEVMLEEVRSFRVSPAAVKWLLNKIKNSF
jgi:hypothetical protein